MFIYCRRGGWLEIWASMKIIGGMEGVYEKKNKMCGGRPGFFPVRPPLRISPQLITIFSKSDKRPFTPMLLFLDSLAKLQARISRSC